MIRRGAWTRPYAGFRWTNANLAGGSSDVLLVGDIIAGTVCGRFALEFYSAFARHDARLLGFMNGPWRALILCSLVGALIVNRTSCVTRQTRIGALLGQACPGCVIAGAVLFGVVLVTNTAAEVSGPWGEVWLALFLGWIWATRLFTLSYVRLTTTGRFVRESVAILGEDATIDQLIERIETEAHVVTVFRRPAGTTIGIGATLAHIAMLARDGAVGLVILAFDPDGRKDVVDAVLRQLRAIPVRVAVCGDARRARGAMAAVDSIAGIPMAVLANRPLRKRDLLIKSLLDKIGALLLLILVSPLLLAISLAIYLDAPGPVLFRQVRTGWCGRLFTVYKFRTMFQVADRRPLGQTRRHDPRCTRVGSFLRRTSLDELPQLWNVLRGEMSLVGPRPHADFLHAAQRCDAFLVTEYLRRQRVKPGLTGWAQVHGYRGAADTPEKLRRRIELDLYYIEHWSLWLDIRIIARTPWAVLAAENAF